MGGLCMSRICCPPATLIISQDHHQIRQTRGQITDTKSKMQKADVFYGAATSKIPANSKLGSSHNKYKAPVSKTNQQYNKLMNGTILTVAKGIIIYYIRILHIYIRNE